MDWQQMRAEYISSDTSYRKLAQKYGISAAQVCAVGKREDWVGARKQYQRKTLAKTLDKMSSAMAGRAVRIQSVADKLLSRIEAAIDTMEGMDIDTAAYRQIAATLKDIKDIQMIRSGADMREQEARIANLRKQAEMDDNGNITVTIDDDLKQYSI